VPRNYSRSTAPSIFSVPESFSSAYRRPVAVQFTITCDGCGRFIASSRMSVRAARAEAQLNRGANHGPDGDRCLACRKKKIAELNAQMTDRAFRPTHFNPYR
jgi:hypothetical protein